MISNRQASVFDTPFLRAPTAVLAIETPIDATNTDSAVAVGTPMESGTYVGSQLIALTSAQGATIRYTTNGSMPNASSLVYTEPLVVSTTSTIKAVALSGNTSSSVATRTYAINPRVLLPYDVNMIASRGWQLARFAPQNNDFTYSVDVVPTVSPGDDSVIGLAWQQDDISSWNSINGSAYKNLLCRMRFAAFSGRLEAYYGNGTGNGAYQSHGTNPDIVYVAGSTYTIVFSVQYAAQTYGVTVSVNGGAAQVLAVGYPWNASPPGFAGVTGYIPTFASFNTLAVYSYRGGMQVRNNLLLSGVGVSPLLPQTIGWQAPVLAENAPDNIVSTEGTLVTAKRFGDSNPVTVNGVVFQGNIASNGIGTTAANYPALASPGTASAALQDLYDSVVYDTSSTHSISGLTIGTTYMLQWFFAEERTNYATRSQTVTIAGYTINLAAPLKAAATKCYFVAAATSQDITIDMGTTLPQIMAFQVRQISGLVVAASLSASPTSITSGSSSTLAWSTGNATATSISQGVISFSGGELYTTDPTQLVADNLYQPTVSSSEVPTGIFAAVPALTAATFATANLYITSTTPISNFIQFTSGGIVYSFNLVKSEVIYQNSVDQDDDMILKWTGSISANSGPLTTPTPAICIINGDGTGAWVASLMAGPVGPFSTAGAPFGETSSIGSSIITVPIAGGSIAVAPVATTTYSILAVGENDTSTTASATVTVVAAWAYTAWTNDADSGITSASTYTTAVNLGGNAVTVNGVPFSAGAAAAALAGTGYSIGGAVGISNYDESSTVAVAGNSATLVRSFIGDGTPRTVTLTGLTPGSTYETSLFSYGWEASGHVQTFASGDSTLTLDQDFYGLDNGIRIVHTFVADNSGTRVLTITPATANTFYLCALANRLLV